MEAAPRRSLLSSVAAQHGGQQRHPHVHALLCLPEVRGARVRVHLHAADVMSVRGVFPPLPPGPDGNHFLPSTAPYSRRLPAGPQLHAIPSPQAPTLRPHLPRHLTFPSTRGQDLSPFPPNPALMPRCSKDPTSWLHPPPGSHSSSPGQHPTLASPCLPLQNPYLPSYHSSPIPGLHNPTTRLPPSIPPDLVDTGHGVHHHHLLLGPRHDVWREDELPKALRGHSPEQGGGG